MTLQKRNNIPTHTENRLSVQVSLTGLSFLVTSPPEHTTVYFNRKKFNSTYTPEELIEEIKNELLAMEKATVSFSEVNIVYATSLYTLVPKEYFDATKASDYLKFNSKILATDYVAHDLVEATGMVVVYVPFININNYFFEAYGTFTYYHALTILTETFLEKEKNSNITKVYLHVQEEHFDLFAIEKGSLRMANTYHYKTPEDFIYYVLFVLEQLQLNPDKVPVTICGALDKEDEVYQILFTYVRHISFYASDEVSVPSIKNEAPHKHLILKHSF